MRIILSFLSYSMLLCPILSYSIMFHSILFYSILCHSHIKFYSTSFYSTLLYSILFSLLTTTSTSIPPHPSILIRFILSYPILTFISSGHWVLKSSYFFEKKILHDESSLILNDN